MGIAPWQSRITSQSPGDGGDLDGRLNPMYVAWGMWSADTRKHSRRQAATHVCPRSPNTHRVTHNRKQHTHIHTPGEKRRNKNKSTRKAVGEYSSAAAEQAWTSFVLLKS